MERSFMRKNEKIVLYDESTGTKKTFTIIKRAGSGGSSLSYFASCGREVGRLKEYYPSKGDSDGVVPVTRRNDNQLSVVADIASSTEMFEEMVNDYLKAYRTLDRVKNEADERSNQFSTFIPDFKVLRGYDEEGNVGGSVYIWITDNSKSLVTFEEYLNNVHKHPKQNPPKTLFTILNTLYNLTECVKTLHMAGLIHGDIKPSNFGFTKRNGRYLTEQVKLFDIDSVYSVYTQFPTLSGTPGFCPAEIYRGKKTHQSDLYSIGATLFYAIAVCDEVPDHKYSDSYYSRIDEIVDKSELLNASPITASLKVKYAISKVLKKCLAKELRNRVDSCTEIKKDLLKVCALLVPYQYKDYLDSNCEMRIIDKELEKYNEADSLFAMQNLLFSKPIYETENDIIKVLVLGCGVYGQQFLDLCLQIGQVSDKKLEVIVASKNKDLDKKEYLKNRPALKDFFEIDGEGDLSESSYGKISFITPSIVKSDAVSDISFTSDEKDSEDKNSEIIDNIFDNSPDINYVFVALGDERLSEKVAKTCHKTASKLGNDATVAFVCSENKKNLNNGVCPVNVSAKRSDNEFFEDIERIAFNVHLVWNTQLNLNVDMKEVLRKFKDEYNYESSVACVLSIRYLLHFIGIEMKSFSQTELEKAAEKFDLYLEQNEASLAELVYIEHRRWVTEKITQGWIARTDYSDCLEGSINDRRKKEHICIVKSRPCFTLEERYRKPSTGKWNKKMWNNPCAADAELDALDIASVELHRTLFRYAEEIKKEYSVNSEDAEQILSVIQKDKNAVIAFNKWLYCIKCIWRMDETQTKLYESYKNDFLEAIKDFPTDKLHQLEGNIGIIDSKTAPLVKAYGMRDYKATDKSLISSIPFILTYKENIKLFVPVMNDGVTEKFNNIATALLLNPKRIIFGIYIRSREEISDIEQTINTVYTYLKKRDIRSVLDFILIFNENDIGIKLCIGDLKAYISQTCTTKAGKTSVISVADEAEIPARLSETVDASVYEYNSSYLAQLLMKNDYYSQRPWYQFDSADRKFIKVEKCKWLEYVSCQQFLTIMDMFSFENADGSMVSLSECDEYEKLWKVYTSNIEPWNELCRQIKEYCIAKNLISEFILSDKQFTEKLEFIILDELYDAYGYIVSYLKDKACVIDKKSYVEYSRMETCRVVLFVGKENVEAAKKLFDDPFVFTNYKRIVFSEDDSTVRVSINNLVVSGMKISKHKKEILEILNVLQEEKYIFNLNVSGNILSFVFSARQVKHLLSDKDNLLKLYIYSKLIDSDFDNAVSGYEIDWGKTANESYFDCVLTKGFRSIMIKCVSESDLSQGYCNTLCSLADKTGINAVPVVITTLSSSEKSIVDSDMKSSSVLKSCGVYILSQEKDIRDIDVAISKIIKRIS